MANIMGEEAKLVDINVRQIGDHKVCRARNMSSKKMQAKSRN